MSIATNQFIEDCEIQSQQRVNKKKKLKEKKVKKEKSKKNNILSHVCVNRHNLPLFWG